MGAVARSKAHFLMLYETTAYPPEAAPYQIIVEGQTEHGWITAFLKHYEIDSKFVFCPRYTTSIRELWDTVRLTHTNYLRTFCFFDYDGRGKREIKALSDKIQRLGNVDLAISNPCFEVWLSYFLPQPKIYFSMARGEKNPQAQLADYVRVNSKKIFSGGRKITGTSFRKSYSCGEEFWYSFNEYFSKAVEFEKMIREIRERDPKCRLAISNSVCTTNVGQTLMKMIELAREA